MAIKLDLNEQNIWFTAIDENKDKPGNPSDPVATYHLDLGKDFQGLKDSLKSLTAWLDVYENHTIEITSSN